MKNRRKTVLVTDCWIILYRNGMVIADGLQLLHTDCQLVQHHHPDGAGDYFAYRYPFSRRERICGGYHCATQRSCLSL